MTDAALGYAILAVALLVVLGVVFIVASRAARTVERPAPPPGVHMPNPSFLPVLFSVSAFMLGAGFAFKGEWGLANPFLAIPGLAGIVVTTIAWVRAANREWIQVEHASHDDDVAAH